MVGFGCEVLTMDARFLSLRSFAFLSSLSLRSYAGLYNEKTEMKSNGARCLRDVTHMNKVTNILFLVDLKTTKINK